MLNFSVQRQSKVLSIVVHSPAFVENHSANSSNILQLPIVKLSSYVRKLNLHLSYKNI